MNDVTSAAPGAPGGDGAQPPAVIETAAASPASSEAAAGLDSTGPGESSSSESTPSLLSSAAGKTPEPAPAAEPAIEAKPADGAVRDGSPEGKKPDEPGKAEADKAEAASDPAAKEATPQAAPAPLSLEDLKLPEGVTLDAEAGKAFVDALNNAELSGKDRGQALIDLHRKEMDRVAKHLTDHQRKVWNDLNAGWKDDIRKDPDLGGNRLNTNLSMAMGVIEEFLSPEEAKELLIHGENNGMNNFRPFIRLLRNIGKRLNVFEEGSVQTGAKPPMPKKGPGSRGWYDNTPNMSGSTT